MPFEQNEKTRNFIDTVKRLIESGEVKNQAAIVDALEWDKTLMSNVMNGRKNVPNDIYRKFTDVFQFEEVPTDADYRDRYIALLEQQLRDQQVLIAELKERMDSRTLQIQDQITGLSSNLAAHDRIAKVCLAYCKLLLSEHEQAKAQKVKGPKETEKEALQRVQVELDKQLVQLVNAELMPGMDN